MVIICEFLAMKHPVIYLKGNNKYISYEQKKFSRELFQE